MSILILDCGELQTTGYSYSGGTGTTYGSTYNVGCETGYTGTPSPAQVTCETGGSWTTVSGCAIVG